mmetsp:Transcript_28493/g.63828  ORF Transcript_28493/g.63828 Transcript_28493/m.63828 type:complete len:132 (-) Transcript_28493:568-963(-)
MMPSFVEAGKLRKSCNQLSSKALAKISATVEEMASFKAVNSILVTVPLTRLSFLISTTQADRSVAMQRPNRMGLTKLTTIAMTGALTFVHTSSARIAVPRIHPKRQKRPVRETVSPLISHAQSKVHIKSVD